MARSVWKELMKLEVRQPGCARAWCVAAANSRAMRSMVAAGTPVIPSAHSGVYLAHFRLDAIAADDILLDEFAICQLFRRNDIDHRQQEGGIGARADGDPLARFGCRLGEARVKVDQLGTPVDGLREFVRLRGGDGFHHVAPHHQDEFHLIVIAGWFFDAVGQQEGGDHGIEAQAALGAVVGRAVAVEQVLELHLAQVVGGGKDHRLSAVLVLDLQHLAGGQVERFLPGGFAEQALAAVAHPDERGQDAVGVIGIHQARLAHAGTGCLSSAGAPGCRPA